ncbi:STAS domain-containing protein [Sulfitobacter alexandrii]|nr:STAS domain-containing protein [Sulfitobacter alexandrii]
MPEPLIPQSRLNVSQAAGLHAALLARKGQDLTVDMGGVTQLGALCLQVFIAAGKSARAAGTALTFVNVPDRILDQMKVMGLSPEAISEGAE